MSSETNENLCILGVCSIATLLVIIGAIVVIIPFSVTLSIAVDNQHDKVQCDNQKTAYVSSISESGNEVIVTIVHPGSGCSDTKRLPYPQNTTLSLQDMVTVYQECSFRCYDHHIGDTRGCPRYYWTPPNAAENDCDEAIGWMSFIVAAAGLIFIIGELWLLLCVISMGIYFYTYPQSFETV